MDLSPSALLVILIVLVLMFGSRRLPKLARSFGEAKREFEKARLEREEKAAKKGELSAPPKALPEKASAWTDVQPVADERVGSVEPPSTVDGTDRQ